MANALYRAPEDCDAGPPTLGTPPSAAPGHTETFSWHPPGSTLVCRAHTRPPPPHRGEGEKVQGAHGEGADGDGALALRGPHPVAHPAAGGR